MNLVLGLIISPIMNFAETILLASFHNSLVDIKILSVRNGMVFKILEIMSEVFFVILLVMLISMPNQVFFWHGIQIDLLEFGIRSAAVDL